MARIIGGTRPARHIYKERRFKHQFGGATFPDFCTDSGLWNPDQDADQAPTECFPAGTQVLIEDYSYRNIEDIALGTRVFTHKGNIKRVTRLFRKQFQGKLVGLKLKGDYRPLTCTPTHPLFVFRAPRSIGAKWIRTEHLDLEKIEVMDAKNVRKGDYLAVPKLTYSKDATTRSFETDPEFLWVLGLYLAEGNIATTGSGVYFSLHARETDFYERVKLAMAKYGAKVSSFKHHTDGSDNCMMVYISGREWARVFLELGHKIHHTKKLSSKMMLLPAPLLMKVVEGYEDGDGYSRSKNGKSTEHTIVGTSEELIKQVRSILLRNGIFCSISKRKQREDRIPAWDLRYVSNPNRTIYLESAGYFFVKVLDVSKKVERNHSRVFNLEVEDDNSYIVNDIAVHNCVGYTNADLLTDIFKKQFSPDFSYAMARWMTRSGPGTDGASFHAGMQASVWVGGLPKAFARFSAQDKGELFVSDAYNWGQDTWTNASGFSQNGLRNVLGFADHFTDIISASFSTKIGVSLGSPWFAEWQGLPNGSILPMPQNLTLQTSTAPWHNYAGKGQKTINSVPYIIVKPWTGGFMYMPREVANAVFSLAGTGALTFDPKAVHWMSDLAIFMQRGRDPRTAGFL